MLCNKVSFWELLDCFDNDLENDFEKNAWRLEHNVEELQGILNRIMQRVVNIITSALHFMLQAYCYVYNNSNHPREYIHSNKYNMGN